MAACDVVSEESALGTTLRHRSLRATAADGVTLAIQDWVTDGQPREAELLLVHGFSQSHRAWFHQVTGSLAQQFRLITFDLRGHGSSDKPADAPYYRESSRWASDVRAVMEASGLHKPFLVAWSYGGRVVLDYLSQFGDAGISGLVMVNATATVSPEVLGPAIGVLRQMVSSDPAIAHAGTLSLLNACMSRSPSQDELAYMLAYNQLVPASVRAHLGGRQADYAQVLRALRVPTLVLHGLRDQINQEAMAAYTAAMVPHARRINYEDAAHMPFWERPARFNDDLAEFVRAQLIASSGPPHSR